MWWIYRICMVNWLKNICFAMIGTSKSVSKWKCDAHQNVRDPQHWIFLLNWYMLSHPLLCSQLKVMFESQSYAESPVQSSPLVAATRRPGLGIRRYLSEGEQVCYWASHWLRKVCYWAPHWLLRPGGPAGASGAISPKVSTFVTVKSPNFDTIFA